ncbi:MAG TPA: hypothetical protein VGX50_20485 [Longimicrobium sp.]|nr:hypothetical protein [Longimicrobium sp.]
MSLTIGSRPQHLEDGDLVAYMDHQMDRSRLRWAASHLEVCGECSARLQGMQSRAGTVASWLGALDQPAGDERKALAMAAVERARFRSRRAGAWGDRRTLAVAAMIALLLTVSFGTLPGRAWMSAVAERLGLGGPGAVGTEEVQTRPTNVTPPPAPVQAELPPAVADESASPANAGGVRRPGLPPGMSAPVRFTPGGNYVLLQVDSRQRVGAIGIAVQETDQAVAQVVAGRTGETLEPTADGIRLRNTRSSRADYTISIPTRYRFIRIKIADEPETTIAVSRASRAWLWNVNLAASDSN